MDCSGYSLNWNICALAWWVTKDIFKPMSGLKIYFSCSPKYHIATVYWWMLNSTRSRLKKSIFLNSMFLDLYIKYFGNHQKQCSNKICTCTSHDIYNKQTLQRHLHNLGTLCILKQDFYIIRNIYRWVINFINTIYSNDRNKLLPMYRMECRT